MSADDPEIHAAAEAVFEDMLADLILDVTISAQREIKRGRVVCGTCGTRCRAHLPLIPSSGAGPNKSLAPQDSSSFSSSRAPSPSTAGTSSEGRTGGYKVGPEKGTGGSTGIGSGSGKIDTNGNAFFDCLVCNRAIASTRYAPHLSSCLGLNGSTRRTAARSAAVKARLGANDRSSPSPYAQSENGDSDNESVSSKKGKKFLNGNGKRGRSPSKTPSAMGKKSKFSSGTATPSVSRPILPPSKLGQPPTNRPPTQLSSPVSAGSPEFSIVSSQGTVGATSRKKLPGPDFGKGADADDVAGGGEYVPGDESSDEGADDY